MNKHQTTGSATKQIRKGKDPAKYWQTSNNWICCKEIRKGKGPAKWWQTSNYWIHSKIDQERKRPSQRLTNIKQLDLSQRDQERELSNQRLTNIKQLDPLQKRSGKDPANINKQQMTESSLSHIFCCNAVTCSFLSADAMMMTVPGWRAPKFSLVNSNVLTFLLVMNHSGFSPSPQVPANQPTHS
jgi:hypothetical protein